MSAASTRVYGNSQVSKIHRVHPSSLFPPWYLRYRPTRGSLRRNEDPTGADGAATNGSPNSFANPWIAVGLATELAGIQNVPGAHGSGGAAETVHVTSRSQNPGHGPEAVVPRRSQ